MNAKELPLQPRTSLFPLFFTVFIDLFGLGIVIPIFAPLFLVYRAGVRRRGPEDVCA